jgi:AcrR family transcriptional regulator
MLASTKEQLVLAGERLIAERGINGVSMLQIGAAAGSGNKSAVQYHFGSKDQLVQAIFEYRLPGLFARRSFLIVEREPTDVSGWLECHVRAVLEQSEAQGSHYMRFVDGLLEHGHRGAFERMPPELHRASQEFNRRLGSYLPDVPEPIRARRIATAMMVVTRAGAHRERTRWYDRRTLPFAVEVADLVDGLVGLLGADVSPQARRAIVDLDIGGLVWPSFF